jgi:flagellin-like protein
MARSRFFAFASDRSGVSPIIGTLLMVSVTVVLAMAAYWVVLPMMNQDVDVEDEKFILDQQSATQNAPNDWDTSFIVYKIRKDEAIPWNTISFTVQDVSGSILTDAVITYGDTDGDGYVQESDTIQLQGMTDAYDGATMKMLYKGEPLVLASISFK